MKIPASIRRLFEDQRALNNRLKPTVDARIAGIKDERWHYVSRIKELASFALKLESGRFGNATPLEDFFACTLVVANAAEIDRAEKLIHDNFSVNERRPPLQNQTHKTAYEFPFDDLRLFVSLGISPTSPPTDLDSITFEVQIKTFLQHAWSIATHNLVYKTDDANWSKERIAFQTKAMLEHAEISIQEAENLATSSALAKEDWRTYRIKLAIALLKRQWGLGELPTDIRRLAENMMQLLEKLRIDYPDLEKILDDGKKARAGAHPSNLSPYATIIQYLVYAEKDKMMALLQGEPKKVMIVIPEEVELPTGIDRAQCRNAIFI
jgi:ppGpp synthetase/RelA/SpoT-type nucleotidyltranferase